MSYQTNIIPVVIVSLGFVLVTLLSQFLNPFIETVLLPIFTVVINLIGDYYRVTQFSIGHMSGNADELYKLTVITTKEVQFPLDKINAGGELSSQTLIGHTQQHFFVLFGILFISLAKQPKKLLLALLLGIPGWLLIEILDVPWVLCGAIEGLVFSYVDPESLDTSPLLIWTRILNSGGRIAISIIVGLIIIQASERLTTLKPFNLS